MVSSSASLTSATSALTSSATQEWGSVSLISDAFSVSMPSTFSSFSIPSVKASFFSTLIATVFSSAASFSNWISGSSSFTVSFSRPVPGVIVSSSGSSSCPSTGSSTSRVVSWATIYAPFSPGISFFISVFISFLIITSVFSPLQASQISSPGESILPQAWQKFFFLTSCGSTSIPSFIKCPQEKQNFLPGIIISLHSGQVLFISFCFISSFSSGICLLSVFSVFPSGLTTLKPHWSQNFIPGNNFAPQEGQ